MLAPERFPSVRAGPAGPAGLMLGAAAGLLLSALFSAPCMAQTREREGCNAGELCPDFALPDVRGNLTRISDFRGRVVLLQFFATW